MKIWSKWIFVVLVSVIFSTLSMKIQVGTDTAESETIGVQKKYGFPISYQTTAPGLAWAQYDLIKFGLNTVVWIMFIGATAAGWKRMKKKGSNQPPQSTAAP